MRKSESMPTFNQVSKTFKHINRLLCLLNQETWMTSTMISINLCIKGMHRDSNLIHLRKLKVRRITSSLSRSPKNQSKTPISTICHIKLLKTTNSTIQAPPTLPHTYHPINSSTLHKCILNPSRYLRTM